MGGGGLSVTIVLQGFAWTASSLSSAASSCKQSLSAPAVCSADVSGIVASLVGLASAGQSVGTSCDSANWPPSRRPKIDIQDFVKENLNMSTAPHGRAKKLISRLLKRRFGQPRNFATRNIDKLTDVKGDPLL